MSTEILRPVDYAIPAGLAHDYTGVDGYTKDDWPDIQRRIDACDMLGTAPRSGWAAGCHTDFHSPEHRR